MALCSSLCSLFFFPFLLFLTPSGAQNSVTTDVQTANQTAIPLRSLELTLTTWESCLGYYDVGGLWDPSFYCNTGIYLFCCGSCFYRFCCPFKGHRLHQSSCFNYQRPVWANTGELDSPVTEVQQQQDRNRTHMIVYIIYGVLAIMVLGSFVQLELEVLAVCITCVTSLTNPIIYAAVNPQFRNEFYYLKNKCKALCAKT